MKNLVNNEIEKEIYLAISKITEDNFKQGNLYLTSNYKDSVFKKILSLEAFQYLKDNLSKYGKFYTYSAYNGIPYIALLRSEEYRIERLNNLYLKK